MKNAIVYGMMLLAVPVFFGSRKMSQKASSPDLEIRFYPQKQVYPYSAKGPGTPADLQSLVLHNIALFNTSGDSISIEGVSLIATKDKEEVLEQKVFNSQLKQEAALYHQYQELGYLKLYDFQFQTSKLLAGTTLAPGLNLGSQESIILTKKALLLHVLPDSIRVKVTYRGIDGTIKSTHAAIAVEKYESPNTYSFPLKGTWFVGGAPNLHSHHRWGILQEYAYDFVQLGKGTKDHVGEGQQLRDYFAFGQPIHSVGEGEVVVAHDGEDESDDNLRKATESMAAWTTRSQLRQQELLNRGFQAVLGNYVIIRHPGNEYSYYIHLKKGSVAVRVGAKVQTGQLLGEVGHSGNSESPHLHFHMADSPDPVNSRSLPVRFSNIESWPDGSHVDDIQYGHIVKTRSN